ncbi:hypothetical protein CEUSTIGMA_g3332.t1 [Chlamydomonas eustigma]|uniref:MORN repeat-containing protein 5 n=1 Tax=Chlamydomonas eustigma TaxID=1157962 RepID=A0A250WYW5_9CHLO|nr:hypothetical protein CEUSTIGMA_g3332.t1 [Chlamydomonas eustigma]|eukprot:GAX75889.1 hypothetical protein CEUSTIGMA_g3332.t1 [Chlamydomonas eustigma]
MDSIKWRSMQWPDGSLYEGFTTTEGLCNRQGVIHYSNSDRYEGEFLNNRMQGYGVYIWRDGTIYRGEWQQGMMHGCGVQLKRAEDGTFSQLHGKFFADDYVGPIMSCTAESASEAATEADVAAALARSLRTDMGMRIRKQARAQHVGSASTPTATVRESSTSTAPGLSPAYRQDSGHQASIITPGSTKTSTLSSGILSVPTPGPSSNQAWHTTPFRWPWQKELLPDPTHNTPSNAITNTNSLPVNRPSASPSNYTKSSIGTGGPRLAGEDPSLMSQAGLSPLDPRNGELGLRTRSLSDRERGLVGGLLQRLVAPEAVGGQPHSR